MIDAACRLLIAVDTDETAFRAVEYVIQMLGGRKDVEIGLIHFVPPLRADTFSTEEDRRIAQDKLGADAAALLERCRTRLMSEGFEGDRVIIRKQIKDCPNLAECIIDEQRAEEFGTVVVGRHSLSRLEEFLTGSVSSNLIQLAEQCAIWVVT